MDRFRRAVEQAKKAILDSFEFTALVDEAIDKYELVEVVHGEWKFIGDSEEPYDCAWMCSVCGKMYWAEDSNMVTEDAHYCPNCGAKMDR